MPECHTLTLSSGGGGGDGGPAETGGGVQSHRHWLVQIELRAALACSCAALSPERSFVCVWGSVLYPLQASVATERCWQGGFFFFFVSFFFQKKQNT